MTTRQEVIDGLMKGGMPQQEASALVRKLVEESRSAGWKKGYDEGIDYGRELESSHPFQ